MDGVYTNMDGSSAVTSFGVNLHYFLQCRVIAQDKLHLGYDSNQPVHRQGLDM